MKKTISLCLLFFSLSFSLLREATGQSTSPAGRPNVLFIAIDDMNDWAGFLGTHPQVKTPHMDALAAQGIVFTNAHCAAPLCGPSRTAILSGLRPTTSGVYTNSANYEKDLPGVTSLPEYFRQQGYYAVGVGKIFHSGVSRIPAGAFDAYGGRWGSSAPFTSQEINLKSQDPFHRVVKNGREFQLPLNGIPADRHWRSTHTFDWGAVDLPDSLFADTRSANWAIDQLQRKHEKPFFLAVGFERPHQPLFNPKRFHDLYPLESVVLPPVITDDLDDLPRAGREYALTASTSGAHQSVEAYGEWEHAVSSYLAAISYVDELVGNIIQALEGSRYADNTLIVLWSDHGWHLGEKAHWGKGTGWYRSTRVPLMIVPSNKGESLRFKAGSVSDRTVNLLDLAPTLAELAGIPVWEEWEGCSLAPLLEDPGAPWPDHTVTTFGYGNHTITTSRWQYIHYFDGTGELYDLRRDPNEFVNLIQDPPYAAIVAQLQKHVPQELDWKHFVRYHNFKALIPADGSPTVLFNLAFQDQIDERTDVAEDYPEVVVKIERWLKRQNTENKYLYLAE